MLQLELVNRYVLDPARLAQGRNDASSNGHFPLNQALMSGTPRNFTLGGPPFGSNFASGAPPVFNPMMGQYAPQMPPAYLSGGGVGPMRNGMRMNNGRNAGPYERGPRRMSGRLSPPRGGGAGRGRPMFVEGGVGTFGTSQAVEGRTMKSYNDLDAAGGNTGGDALDY